MVNIFVFITPFIFNLFKIVNFFFFNNSPIYRQDMMNHAQERCYYLTFFPARHILAFYDYFTSEKLDKENEEECKTLIRFVNSKAQSLPRKQGVSRGSKDYLNPLCEIGDVLKRTFRDIPKQTRKLKTAGQLV